jgi:hypothetical protein
VARLQGTETPRQCATRRPCFPSGWLSRDWNPPPGQTALRLRRTHTFRLGTRSDSLRGTSILASSARMPSRDSKPPSEQTVLASSRDCNPPPGRNALPAVGCFPHKHNPWDPVVPVTGARSFIHPLRPPLFFMHRAGRELQTDRNHQPAKKLDRHLPGADQGAPSRSVQQ